MRVGVCVACALLARVVRRGSMACVRGVRTWRAYVALVGHGTTKATFVGVPCVQRFKHCPGFWEPRIVFTQRL